MMQNRPGSRQPGNVARSLSERVAMARVLCIFFMTFVHVQPGIAQNVYDREAGLFDIVYFVMTRLVGLSAVSLLGIVSGYFIVAGLSRRDMGAVLRGKVGTLIVPLATWNTVMFALLVAYGILSGNWRDMPEMTLPGFADAFLAVGEWPLVVPLWFLRDLFVCCLLSPLLLEGLRRSALAVFLLLAAYTLFGDGLLLMQRPQLLLFFSIGMWLRLSGRSESGIDRLSMPLVPAVVIVAILFVVLRVERVSFAGMNQPLHATLDMVLRLTMAATVWHVTRLAVAGDLSRRLLALEPYVFFLFCSHAIVFQFAGIPLRRIFGNYGSDLFSMSFFAQPFIALAAAVIGLQIMSRLPLLPALFNAGRRVPGRATAPHVVEIGRDGRTDKRPTPR